MKDKYRELAGYEPDDASDIGIRIKVLAGEIYSASAAVEWLKRQTFYQTASGEQLDERAAERGVARKPASGAVGVLTFSRSAPLWFPAVLPAGTVCATSGEGAARYVTTEDATLPANSLSLDVPARAETPGAAGNALAGTVTVLVTPSAAVESVTNSAAFTGGTDGESDDALRARLLQRCAQPANGTNAAWYRQLALSCAGVASANVVPRANGVGTVAVYLGGKGGAASAEAVQAVKELIGDKREINVDVTVEAAQTAAADVACTVKAKAGHGAFAVRVLCDQAVKDYFSTLGVGEPVVAAAISAKLFATGLIDDCAFSTQNRQVAANQLAVPGSVDVTVEA